MTLTKIQADQTAFTPSGTGATVRTIDSKLEDVVSVKDFGAKGDGTTNDTTAFINAINSGATTIFIPEGTYRTGDVVGGTIRTIEIANKNNITLQGANKATTIIKKNNSINQQVIAFSNNQNIAVKGLTIDGNSANNTSGHGIRLSNVDGAVIEDVIIQNIDVYAIGLQDGSNRNININRFDLRNIDKDAIDIKEKDNANVSNNIIISNGSILNFGITATDQAAIDIRGAVTISNVNIEFNNQQNIGLRLRVDGTSVSDSDPTQTDANGGPAAVAISNVYMFGDIEVWKPNVEYKIINPFYNENSHPVHGTKTLVLNKDTSGSYSVYEATADHNLNEIAPTHTTGTVNGWGRIRDAYTYTGIDVEPKTATVIADGAQDYVSGNFVINDNKTYRANATITDNSHTPTHTTLGQVVSNWMFVGPANDPITEHVFNNIFVRNANLGNIEGNGGLYNNLVTVNGVSDDALNISGENNTFIGLKIRKPFVRPIDILPNAKNNRILGFHLSGYAPKIRTGTGANYTANDYVIATNQKTYKANTTITNNSVDPTHSSGTTGNWDFIAGAHKDAIRIQGGATNTVISGGHIDEGMTVNIGETGTVVIRDVLNFDTTSNLISADVAVDSTGEKTVIIDHNLTNTPNDEDISTSLVRSTGNPNDFALDYPPLLYFKSSTQIAFKIKVGTASGTSGARIKVAVLIRARQS
tara:strand:- start:645 stop:2741 length:2097 start_codon:yes stop_codon:yes gene_type:complete